MPRREQIIWVPPTTSRTVVFPFNEVSNTFETEFYEPELTDDKVSLEEINRFISNINAERHKEATVHSCYECIRVCIFILDVGLLFLLLLGLFLGDIGEFSLSILTNGEMILLSWCFLCFIDIFFKVSEMKDESYLQPGVMERCQATLEEENAILRSQGLKWHLPDQFPAWIELTKDMKKTNNHWELATQVPIRRTTQNQIIFPVCLKGDKKIWQFSQESFSPDMVDGQISCQEVQKFFSQINTCFREVSIPSPKWTFTAEIIALCKNLDFFGLLYISNHFPNFLPTFALMIIAIISVGICEIFSFNVKREESRKKRKHLQVECDRIIEKYNESLQSRGFRWHLFDGESSWLELCKDSAHQNLSSRPSNPEDEPVNPPNDLESGNQVIGKIHNKFAYAQLHDEE